MATLLAPEFESGRVTGMQVTNCDPDRDPDGRAGAGLVNWLVRVLAGR